MAAVHTDVHRWRDLSVCRTEPADGFPALKSFPVNSARPVVVLLWDAHEFGNVLQPNKTAMERCPVPCAFVRSLSLSCLDEADAVVLHGPTLEPDKPLPVHRALHQVSRMPRHLLSTALSQLFCLLAACVVFD